MKEVTAGGHWLTRHCSKRWRDNRRPRGDARSNAELRANYFADKLILPTLFIINDSRLLLSGPAVEEPFQGRSTSELAAADPMTLELHTPHALTRPIPQRLVMNRSRTMRGGVLQRNQRKRIVVDHGRVSATRQLAHQPQPTGAGVGGQSKVVGKCGQERPS